MRLTASRSRSCYEIGSHSTIWKNTGRSASVPHFSSAGVHVGQCCQQTKAVNQFPHFRSGDRGGFELRLATAWLGDHIGPARTKAITSLTCIYIARGPEEFRVTKSARGYNNDLGQTLTLYLRFVREHAPGLPAIPRGFRMCRNDRIMLIHGHLRGSSLGAYRCLFSRLFCVKQNICFIFNGLGCYRRPGVLIAVGSYDTV